MSVPDIDLVRKVPRLVVAINEALVAADNADENGVAYDDKTAILKILNHVASRLSAASLNVAWMTTDGLRTRDGNGVVPNDSEELWARTVTELLLCLPYVLPSTAYSSGTNFSDGTFYAKMYDDGGSYPIVVECQHSCTFALITRGCDLEDFRTKVQGGFMPDGASAGESRGLPVFKGRSGPNPKPSGSWVNRSSDLDATNSLDASPAMSPGTLVEFNTPPANSTGSHIAFVLRTHKNPHLVQFYDTGGVWIDGDVMGETRRMVDVTAVDGGTFDNPYCQKYTGAAAYSGMGVLPSRDLGTGIDRAQRLFPLGIARLILTRRADGKVLYATPLLRMHWKGLCDNFAIARYMWSLRSTPCFARIEARWEISVPRGSQVSALFARAPEELASFAGRTGFPTLLARPITDLQMLEHSNITVDANNGKVFIQKRMKALPSPGEFHTRTSNDPWGLRVYESDQTVPALGDVPDYLRGGQRRPPGLVDTP